MLNLDSLSLSISWLGFLLAALSAGFLLAHIQQGRAGLPLSVPSNSLDVLSDWTTWGHMDVLIGLALVLGPISGTGGEINIPGIL